MISKFFGEKIIYDNLEFYLFPKIGKLNDLDKLVEAKTGYRSKYLYSINLFLLENKSFLENLKKLNYIESKKELQKLMGVGVKVADCICLFGLGHEEAFPIDTWVKQAIENFYLKRKSKNLKEIEEFIKKNFKGNVGLKQQYLFHYIRNL